MVLNLDRSVTALARFPRCQRPKGRALAPAFDNGRLTATCAVAFVVGKMFCPQLSDLGK
jgi:hypothetical protein